MLSPVWDPLRCVDSQNCPLAEQVRDVFIHQIRAPWVRGCPVGSLLPSASSEPLNQDGHKSSTLWGGVGLHLHSWGPWQQLELKAGRWALRRARGCAIHVEKCQKEYLPNCSWQSSLGGKILYSSSLCLLYCLAFFVTTTQFFAKNTKAMSKAEIISLDSFISQMSK